MKKIFLYASVMILSACQTTSRKKGNEMAEKEVTRTVVNLSFKFPSNGFAYDNQNQFVEECLEGLKSNTDLLRLPEYKDSITIQFLRSREEMKLYTGMTPSGIVFPHKKMVYLVANADPAEVKPPIKHELMHMITLTTWGYPKADTNWMNEGLAAYAENNCNGYNVEQIYRYLLKKNMLIPMEALTTSFYTQPEMIAYHQAAFMVQYLFTMYGVEKFKELWTQGFNQFEQIYHASFREIERNMKKKAIHDFPVTPDIDWDKFQKGCM